jgi:sulfur relay (sulfurtransferase) complex TusBCD TusD component (DsrE family)
MAKNIVVVIQEDPRKTHRPVEALRIALGLAAGSHKTTVVLLSEAVRLLSEDTDDIVDVDILEKYLPSLEHLEIPFILHTQASSSHIRDGFHPRYETDESIRQFIQSMDSSLVF